MSYRVELRPAALRQLRGLSAEIQGRIGPAIDALAVEPRGRRARRLSGQRGVSRIRVGDYRIVYIVDDAAVLVTITRIGDRRDVYR